MEALAECDLLARELGDTAYWRFIQGSAHAWTHFLRGRLTRRCWGAVFIEEAEAGQPHRLVSSSCQIRRAH